jgi:putative peptidoglycan lipid II flippase
MAFGALVSRITGFLRTAVLGAVLGAAAVGDAYATATMLPGILYEILLGGALAGILVPYLIRARGDDPDHGRAYEQRLVTLAVLVFAGAAALATASTPLMVKVLSSHTAPAADTALVSTLAYVVLPAIFFYGLGAVLTAVLTARGHFAMPTWSPIANNTILIATGLVFLAIPGPAHLTPSTITLPQVAVLGGGTLLGVIAQATALLPALRRTGFRWRLRLGFDQLHIRELGRTTAWLVCYLAASQVGVFVVLALAKRAGDQGGPGPFIYSNGWLLLMMGYGIVALPIITALMPTMSTTTAARSEIAANLGLGARMILLALTPVSAGLVALAVPVAVLLFEWHRYTHADALDTARVLVFAGLGLLPYAISQLQTFAFFALRDARTPALLNLPVVALRIGLDLLFYFTLPAHHLVMALMLSNGISYLAAVIGAARLLHHRVVGTAPQPYLVLGMRILAAGVVSGLVALGIVDLLRHVGVGVKAVSLLEVLVGAPALVATYLVCARLLGIREVGQLTAFLGRGRRGKFITTRP